MAGGIRRYLAWFYAQVDRVFAMSSRSRDTLIQLGVEPEKLSVMPVASTREISRRRTGRPRCSRF